MNNQQVFDQIISLINVLNINFDDFKEKSILQRIIAPKSALSKPILRCEPDEVILQSKIELN